MRRNLELPKGVLRKNLKTFVYLGAAMLVIVAALFSSSGKKTPAQQAGAKGQPPQPTLQDNTDSNVQELKNQIQAERQKERQATMAAAAMGDPSLASTTPAQRTTAAAYGPNGVAAPCVPGQPCSQSQQGDMQMQLTPVQQQAQLIAAKERERADNSRFASNLVYSGSAGQPQQQQQGQAMSAQYGPAERQANSNLGAPESDAKREDTPGAYKRPLEANVDSGTRSRATDEEGYATKPNGAQTLEVGHPSPRFPANTTPGNCRQMCRFSDSAELQRSGGA